MTRAEIEARSFDLQAVNPNMVDEEDKRTPSQLLDVIESKRKEIAELSAAWRAGG